MKCYDHHKKSALVCKNKECRYWIECKENNNCTIIGAKSNKNMTLEDIGKIFKVTRMRICQIEKRALEKIKLTLLQ